MKRKDRKTMKKSTVNNKVTNLLIHILVIPKGVMLVALIVFNFGLQAQNEINGTISLAGEERPLGEVIITIDGSLEAISDQDGVFIIRNYLSEEKPKVVRAYKEGFELSTWTYEKRNLSIAMRPATTMTISGRLIDFSDLPLGRRKVTFLGNEVQSIRTEVDGNFNITIPYRKGLLLDSGSFLVEGQPIDQIDSEWDAQKGKFQVKLQITDGHENSIYTVQVNFENNDVAKDLMVKIDEVAFVTDSNGEFRFRSSKSAHVDWDFGKYSVLRIDTLLDRKQIRVYLINQTVAIRPVAITSDSSIFLQNQEDSLLQSRSDFEARVSEDLSDIQSFYIEQKNQFDQQNQRINFLNDSISLVTEFGVWNNSKLIRQLTELNKSIESSSRAFNEARENSLKLIIQLQQKLDERDQIIKVIEEEKEMLTSKFQKNFKLFISVIISISLLLILAIWVIRRFVVQKKIIERTKKQLIQAQKMAKMGSVVYDAVHKKFYYSDNLFNILRTDKSHKRKYEDSEPNGIFYEELIHEGDRLLVQNTWQEGLTSKKQFSVQFRLKNDENIPVYLEMNSKVEVDQNEELVQVSTTLQDISEKKANELNLLKAMDEVREASRIKEEFLASMSHEIRTPLNAIIGLTDQLVTLEPSDDQMKNLKTIQFSGQHLLSLVNDILDFSKIKAGKIKIENRRFNLRSFVNQVVDIMSINALEKGISMETDIDARVPEYIKSDQLRINQILINIIGNAIKFTDKGSVTLSLTVVEESDSTSTIRFGVKDTGIGIAEDKLGSIFESFEQENISTTRKYGGTGLGLSISKELVTLIGGELKLNSTLGQGSDFYFSAVFEKVKVEPNVESPSYDEKILQKMPGLRVLCVEDNKINQLVVSQYFNNWEISVVYADTGAEAVQVFEDNVFDLVFMDLRLPDMSGFEVTKALFTEFPGCKVPIVAFSAELDENVKKEILEVGMVDFITKPFKPEELNSIILKYTS